MGGSFKDNDMAGAGEYRDRLEQYMRSIWDDSEFPDLKEYYEYIEKSYRSSQPIEQTADHIIDEVQAKHDSPELEKLIDLIFSKNPKTITVKQLRRKYHLTQKELAEKVGTTTTSISMYENGRWILNQHVIDRVWEEYGERLRPVVNRKPVKRTWQKRG